QRQLDVSVGYVRLGQARTQQGDSRRAEAAFRAALGYREALVKRDGNNPTWLTRLALARQNLGNVLHTAGDLAGALNHFEEARALLARVRKQKPEEAEAHQHWASLTIAAALVYQDRGDVPHTLSYLQRAQEVAREYSRRTPSSRNWEQL